MDPDVATFAAVSIIVVGLVGSLATITVVMVRMLNKPRSAPPALDGKS